MNLVSAALAQLNAGHPAIVTEPDPYAPASTVGWSHIVVFYGWDSTSLTAMDPWTDGEVTHSFVGMNTYIDKRIPLRYMLE